MLDSVEYCPLNHETPLAYELNKKTVCMIQVMVNLKTRSQHETKYPFLPPHG
jgi:hypothetical protein